MSHNSLTLEAECGSTVPAPPQPAEEASGRWPLAAKEIKPRGETSCPRPLSRQVAESSNPSVLAWGPTSFHGPPLSLCRQKSYSLVPRSQGRVLEFKKKPKFDGITGRLMKKGFLLAPLTQAYYEWLLRLRPAPGRSGKKEAEFISLQDSLPSLPVAPFPCTSNSCHNTTGNF